MEEHQIKKGFFTFEILNPPVADDFCVRSGRRQKLTKPIFITPTGVIEGFPTAKDQFFSVMPEQPIVPVDNPLIRTGSGYAMISWIDLEKSARYRRWLDGKKEDTRSTLEESYSVFQNSGRDGLKKLYSKTHVFYLLREFKKRGWLVD